MKSENSDKSNGHQKIPGSVQFFTGEDKEK